MGPRQFEPGVQPMINRRELFFFLAVFSLVSIAQSQPFRSGTKHSGQLIPSHTTMVTAWDVPQNPLTDSLLGNSYADEQIRWGFRIFTDTPKEAGRLVKNDMSCNNCHLNAGQREKAMPLVGVASTFPEYNKRAGRLFSLEDRIVGCFMRSQNGAAINVHSPDSTVLPSPDAKEVLALAAYLTWLSRGHEVGRRVSWRGQNKISSDKLIPIEQLDAKRGETLFMEKCSACHGEDGQGKEIGDKKAGPLWGPSSWNDGAGAARIYTLAGMIRYMMPYLNPGSLTDEEAQNIAAFINSKPRPVYPFKAMDYRTEKLPIDAIYYRKK